MPGQIECLHLGIGHGLSRHIHAMLPEGLHAQAAARGRAPDVAQHHLPCP